MLAVALLGAACGGRSGAVSAETAAAPALAVVHGDFAEHLLLSGELVAEESVALIAPDANLWPLQIRWLVEDGASVAAGNPVVEFDNSSLAPRLEEARLQVVERTNALASQRARTAAAVAQARAKLEQQHGEVAKARLEAEVPRELRVAREHANFQLALERAQLELEATERALRVAETAGRAEIALAELELEKSRTEVRDIAATLERLILRAPRAGVALVRESREQGRAYRPGDNAWPGETVAEIPNLATLAVEARLFDVDDGRLAPGMPVAATLDAFPDHAFAGRVREIGAAAQQIGNTSQRRSFSVILELAGLGELPLRPGMSVRAEVELERLAGVRLVPRASLELEDPREPRLRLADGGRTRVVLGRCNAHVCVLEDGPPVGTRLGAAS